MSKKKKQSGFGLLETLLTLGAVSALSLGIYMVLKPTSATAQVKQEQTNLRDLSSAVDRSWGLLGSFQGVSADRVRTDGLAPKRMVDGSTLRTAWGTSVSINPHSLNHPNDGFTVVYPLTPAEVCVRLATAVARDTYDIRVDGSSLFTAGEIDPNAAVAECGRRDVATMEFVYHSGLVAGTAVASPILVLPPTPPSVTAPGTAPVGGPVSGVGDVGNAIGPAPVTASPPVGSVPTPPALPPSPGPVTSTTPAPSGLLPPISSPVSTVTACVPPSNTVQNQNLYCAAGQYGIIDQMRFATWSCPEAWDKAVQGPFSAWTTTSNTCTACPAPSTQSQNQWVFTPTVCAAGQYGIWGWEREQTQSRSVTYTCPSATVNLPAPNYGSWSAWTDTGAKRYEYNTCTNCPAAWLQYQSQWVFTPTVCPAGQYGIWGWEREQQQNRWVSYNCPAGTASLPAPTYGGWSAWWDTGARRYEYNTCTNCPAAWLQYQSQWVYTVGGCPAGQTGSITYEREQQQNRWISYNCPAGTASMPAPTYGGWSAWWDTGATRNVNNTCRSSLNYFWEHNVLRPDSGGTQSDRTQYQVFSVTGMDALPSSCWQSNAPTGSIWTWRGSGYFPGFYSGKAECACNASRVGWEVSWNQSEYFAYDEDYQMICVGR